MILTHIEVTLCLDWLIDLNGKLKITKWIFASVSSAKNELRLQHFNHIIPYRCEHVRLVISHTIYTRIHVCVHFSICIMQMIFVCFGHTLYNSWTNDFITLFAVMSDDGLMVFSRQNRFEVYTVWTMNVVNMLFVKETTF